MNIITAQKDVKDKWNKFVEENFPPIGAFMQTWEWGEFQKEFGRDISRCFIEEDGKTIAIITIVNHTLPLGFSYGYAPRGPVTEKGLSEEKIIDIFEALKTWSKKEHPRSVFLRLEPPLGLFNSRLNNHGFRTPGYYIQPRYNLAVPLSAPEEEICLRFHPSTRSNIRRAEKRGVSMEIRNEVTEDDYEIFSMMMKDTIRRNSGVNAYPGETYFRSFFKSIPPVQKVRDPNSLSFGVFYGYQNGEPAATHVVLFFGSTATYLYGASYSRHLNSKVMTYLHFEAMKEAKRLGFHYYDLGGIDEVRWKTLTDFKRQFRGEEFSYMGNVNIVFKPVLYLIYNLFRLVKR